ncbi:hypothetical protein PENSTE_c021G09859 [Penicillium steckii]|uniref:AB hydrolase-1 domain-containing protein n=1 Tax=Penicillium steckii TaxID=303698 RepID=A0A1V6SUL4_9EURO|nr:hypothetical protein PENSTE_c021G09859 [Penicillium steckii]
MLAGLSLRRNGRRLIEAWVKRPSQPRVQIHTQTGKRTCLISKVPPVFEYTRIRSSRTFFTETIPPVLLPPAIFTGLLLGLWTWKCFWIIVMQNKLLYLSWLPPFSRSDKISDYMSECKPVQWEEKRIKSLDGTELAICEGRISTTTNKERVSIRPKKKSVVICYFQGNGGSTPLRLPLLSQVLRTLRDSSTVPDRSSDIDYTIVALSYRGYWTSSGSATQSGIERDAQAFLRWVSASYSRQNTELQIVLWGHSLGSAVASSALSKYLQMQSKERTPSGDALPPISGLIMEAPISNIKDMLIALYPQKWLPYRYLWPFSWNTWCTATALEGLAGWRSQAPRQAVDKVNNGASGYQASSVPPILILSAENDEVIPSHVAAQLEKKGHDLGLNISRKEVLGAMHTEGPTKHDGRKALVDFIRSYTS